MSVYCSGWLIYRPSCHRCRRGKHCSTVLEAGADEGTFFLLSQTISCMCPKSHVLLCRSCFPSVACLPTTSSGWLSFLLWDSEVAKVLRYFLPYTNPEWIFGLHSNLMWLYVSWNVFSCKSFCDCLAAYESLPQNIPVCLCHLCQWFLSLALGELKEVAWVQHIGANRENGFKTQVQRAVEIVFLWSSDTFLYHLLGGETLHVACRTQSVGIILLYGLWWTINWNCSNNCGWTEAKWQSRGKQW